MSEHDNALLLLCVANSSRSQMAEGWARKMAPEGLRVYSAGSQPTQVNPFAVEAMREVDIDITAHRSKLVDDVPVSEIGTVITLCADEVCPVFPEQVERLHWPFEDPAAATGSEEEILNAFRRVRDQIRATLMRYFAAMPARD